MEITTVSWLMSLLITSTFDRVNAPAAVVSDTTTCPKAITSMQLPVATAGILISNKNTLKPVLSYLRVIVASLICGEGRGS